LLLGHCRDSCWLMVGPSAAGPELLYCVGCCSVGPESLLLLPLPLLALHMHCCLLCIHACILLLLLLLLEGLRCFVGMLGVSRVSV
jgi:hypothetical protein